MNLSSLKLRVSSGVTWLGIVDNCPNLEYLELEGGGLKDLVMVKSINDWLKKRLKRLSSLKVNRVPLRLGTDWKG
jgi:hypothetical protein